jgi:hypothetical protein
MPQDDSQVAYQVRRVRDGIELVEFAGGDFPQGFWASLSCGSGIFAVEDVFSAAVLE